MIPSSHRTVPQKSPKISPVFFGGESLFAPKVYRALILNCSGGPYITDRKLKLNFNCPGTIYLRTMCFSHNTCVWVSFSPAPEHPRQHSRKIVFPKGLCHQNSRYYYCCCCRLYPSRTLQNVPERPKTFQNVLKLKILYFITFSIFSIFPYYPLKGPVVDHIS